MTKRSKTPNQGAQGGEWQQALVTFDTMVQLSVPQNAAWSQATDKTASRLHDCVLCCLDVIYLFVSFVSVFLLEVASTCFF